MSAILDFPFVVLGDSIPSKNFTLKRYKNQVLEPLTGATVTFELLRGGHKIYLTKDNADNGGISIQDEGACIVSLAPISTAGLTAATYEYVLRVEYSDGFIVTFLGGEIEISSKDVKETMKL